MSDDWASARRGTARTGKRIRDTIPSLIESETDLANVNLRLDEIQDEYAQARKMHTAALRAWEEHLDRCIVFIAAKGERTSEDVRRARAKSMRNPEGFLGEDLYAAYLITMSTLDIVRNQLAAVQSQLSGVQTQLKGLRQATGLAP